jgi:hypothetical protein
LRAAALANKPWRFSTGPRTAAGKQKVAANGKRRQKGSSSVRERRQQVADATEMVQRLRQLRGFVLRATSLAGNNAGPR